MHPTASHQYSLSGDDAPLKPAVVLDTNAVMDWLVFQDPVCAAWSPCLGSACVRWLATAAMREELAHVLARGVASVWNPSLVNIWSAWDRHAITAQLRTSSSAAIHIRCTDGDDQKFLDLALANRARWLVSRDKALLNLRRRVQPFGLQILTPRDWSDALKRLDSFANPKLAA